MLEHRIMGPSPSKVQPFSQKSRTQPVAKEFQIGLYNEFFVGGAAADEQEGAE